jgi:MFS family permease
MDEAAERERAPALPRVWNRNFVLLWQGQLVSALGDTIYAIALGFWILQVTGSTALMGSLMAATMLPRILVAPFAGVIVDRVDRKRLLIFMDIVRGIAVVLVGAAALTHHIQIWMAFAAGIIIGLGGAFFQPGVSAILPTIVPRERLIQANSAYSLIYTGSGMLGNSAGGFLFQVLGAPLMFLFNGLSYLVSSFTLLFMRVPAIPRPNIERHFFADLQEGLRFAWRLAGLRTLFFTAAVLNFFGIMGYTLILPLFQKTPGLGAGRYGITMACFAGGLFSGFLAASRLRFRPAVRFNVFMASAFISVACFLAFALIGRFPSMLALGFIAGAANAILNSFLPATIQTVVPPALMGKVSALLLTLSGGLMPLAMAAAGALAEVIPMRTLMASSYAVMLLCFTPLLFADGFKRFITFDPSRESVESLMS